MSLASRLSDVESHIVCPCDEIQYLRSDEIAYPFVEDHPRVSLISDIIQKRLDRASIMVEVTHTPSNITSEMLRLGPIKIRVLSAGGAQKSCLIMHLPRRTPGFPLHSHRMHATTFLVLKGRIRWNSPNNSFDARAGSFIEVPAGSKYGFSNPFNEVAEMFVVYFPGFYVECMRELAALWTDQDGVVVSVEQQVQVMKDWGTVMVTEKSELEEEEKIEEDDEDSGGEAEERGTGLQCMA